MLMDALDARAYAHIVDGRAHADEHARVVAKDHAIHESGESVLMDDVHNVAAGCKSLAEQSCADGSMLCQVQTTGSRVSKQHLLHYSTREAFVVVGVHPAFFAIHPL